MTAILTYLGILLSATSMLMIEILLMRITSVVATYHLAFFVIALAMLGMTAGAIHVFLNPEKYAERSVPAGLTRSALGFAIVTPLAFAYLMSGPLVPVDGLMEFVALLGYGAVAAVPFALIGVTLTLALTRAGLAPGLAYGVDLCGAAGGCLLIVPLLGWIDGPSAALGASALAAAAGLCFAVAELSRGRDSFAPGLKARLALAAVAAVGLAALAGANATADEPSLRPAWSRLDRQTPEKFVHVAWNTHSRVTVDRTVRRKPAFWARGKNIPDELLRRIESRRILIDGSAATRIFNIGGQLERAAFLDYAMPNFAHRLRQSGSAAIIGVGGGRDVLAAARAGHDPIVGVEINDRIVDLHRRVMPEFSGIAALPGVELHVDEARSFLTRDTRRYDVITMSLIDTWAASGAGAYSLTENSLYTLEAWVTFLDRLTPDGILTVSRWFGREAGETARMLSLTMAALWAHGAEVPRDHIIVLRGGRVSTLLVSPTPFTAEDRERARREADRLGFAIAAMPGGASPNRLIEAILASPSPAALDELCARQGLDISPPSDDRPFFFNMLRLRDWQGDEVRFANTDITVKSNLQATRTLVHAILVSVLLTLVALAWPLWRRRGALAGYPRGQLIAASTYFALIGLGFMFVEIGLLSRLNVFLGQPVLALAVALGGIIFAAGVGSLMSGWVPLTRPLVARLYPLAPVALALGAFAAIDPVMDALAGSEAPARILACLALIVPAGLGMGLGFPLGLRLVQARDRGRAIDITPWLWGINGAFGVCASGLALACSMTLGISTTLLVGAACYLLLLACTWLLAPRSGG